MKIGLKDDISKETVAVRRAWGIAILLKSIQSGKNRSSERNRIDLAISLQARPGRFPLAWYTLLI